MNILLQVSLDPADKDIERKQRIRNVIKNIKYKHLLMV